MPEDKKRIKAYLRAASLGMLAAIAVLFFLVNSAVSVVKIEGSSMEPVLKDQERIIIFKTAVPGNSIRRFDIIVFSFPGKPRAKLIKRVIGLPGEKIEIRQNRLYINDRDLEFAGSKSPFARRYALKTMKPLTIPPDHYFVMGDNLDISLDSRTIGVIPAWRIIGRAVLRYWPFSRLGSIS